MAKIYDTRFENKYGYVQGYFQHDVFHLSIFIVHRKYRGKGFGNKVAELIPEGKVELYAYPLYGMEKGKFKGLELNQLVQFYESLGFKKADKQHAGAGIRMMRT